MHDNILLIKFSDLGFIGLFFRYYNHLKKYTFYDGPTQFPWDALK